MLDQQGLDERSAGLGGGRSGAGLRRQRLLARVPGRADVPRRAHHAHLRGHERDQPAAHPDATAEAVAGARSRRGRAPARSTSPAGAVQAVGRRLARSRASASSSRARSGWPLRLLGQAVGGVRRPAQGRAGSLRRRSPTSSSRCTRSRAASRGRRRWRRAATAARRSRRTSRASTPATRPSGSRRHPARWSPRWSRGAPTRRWPKASAARRACRHRRIAARATRSPRRHRRGEYRLRRSSIAGAEGIQLRAGRHRGDDHVSPATRSSCCSRST